MNAMGFTIRAYMVDAVAGVAVEVIVEVVVIVASNARCTHSWAVLLLSSDIFAALQVYLGDRVRQNREVKHT